MLTDFHGENKYSHSLDMTINILLYLLYHIILFFI